MEGCLIALSAGEWVALLGSKAVTLLMVGLGLGMVIFVHELGHFAVAKWCGVKCEKFYLGFDIYGKKLFHFTRGETEYGIGVLPLGGYVKMLGQDDNPSRQADERERSLQGGGEAVSGDSSGTVPTGAPALDPRSYLAKSVPQRMAIISAGVIMNVIFALVVFVIAHMVGFKYWPAQIAAVAPGQPAWVIGMEPGDEVLEIAGKRAKSFDNIMQEVMFAGNNTELAIKVRRPDSQAPEGYRDINFVVQPDSSQERRMIGVAPTKSLMLFEESPVEKYSPADSLRSLTFKGGDEIIAVNDIPVKTYVECAQILAANAGQPVVFKVRQKDAEGFKEVTMPPVKPRPVRTLGLILALDKVNAIKLNSPAAKAGLLKDDLLVQMNGEPIGNPLTFPERIRRLHGTEVKLLVQRGNDQKELTIVPEDRPALPDLIHSPIIDVAAIGAAYKVLNRVEKVTPDSPAAKAVTGKFEGELVSAEIIPDPKDADAVEAEDKTDKMFNLKSSVFKFGDKPGEVSWPLFFHRLQMAAPGSTVKIKLQNHEAVITPAESTEFFLPDRGLNFTGLRATRQTATIGEALQLSVEHALETSTLIYRFLQRVTDWKVSQHAGGPVGIAMAAWTVASLGLSDFLMFLGLLSVNLAVINFLPIPVLDGGHMVFLAYEGIRGKPADERITERLHMAGLALLLCLIVFVFCLDGRRLIEMWL